MCNLTTMAKLLLSISAYFLCTWQCFTNSLALLKIYPEAGCPVFISGEAFLRRVLRPSSSDAEEICFLGRWMDSLIYFIRGPATTTQASLRDRAYSRGGVEREWEECKVQMREGEESCCIYNLGQTGTQCSIHTYTNNTLLCMF